MYFVYNFLATVIVLVILPFFILRMIITGQIRGRFKEMCGILPKAVLEKIKGKKCIWAHAASVGEIVATSSIIKETAKVMPDQTFLVSVVTPTGYQMAKRIIPEATGIIYFPLDLPWLVEKVVQHIRPSIFMMVETELWPNFLKIAKKYDVKTLMVNGRISDKSAKRYHMLMGILKDMLNNVDLFCMQSEQDAQYIISLGAEPSRVVVTGNTKYDQTYTDIKEEQRTEVRCMLGLQNAEPVIIVGSTHKGEEEMLLAAFQEVRGKYPQVAMVIAPRHVERAGEIEELYRQAGIVIRKRTEETMNNGVQVVILDTIGELGKIYSIADIVFVGGSLIPKGGHNILEPAAHGKPVLVGPHMFNFKDIYALLSKRGVCETVQNPTELGVQILRLLDDPELRAHMSQEALRIIEENKGASAKSAQYVKQLFLQTE
jgi:3-deoxy-D-manno-octulosonic-acid transferase